MMMILKAIGSKFSINSLNIQLKPIFYLLIWELLISAKAAKKIHNSFQNLNSTYITMYTMWTIAKLIEIVKGG